VFHQHPSQVLELLGYLDWPSNDCKLYVCLHLCMLCGHSLFIARACVCGCVCVVSLASLLSLRARP
jgi:hypothetical protein